MKNQTTEIVFILDRSGSMQGLEADTIGGFNSTIEKQREEEGKAYVTTVLFDDKVETIHDRVPLEKVEPMTRKDYYVRGCTALLDAVGGAISHIKGIHKYAREEDVPQKTIFVITTDGLENASHRYTVSKVKEMIKEQTEKGWDFVFLGANIDVVSVARDIGINEDMAVEFSADSVGVKRSFGKMSDAICCARRCDKIDLNDKK